MAIQFTNTGLEHLLNGMCSKWESRNYFKASLFPIEDTKELELCCYSQLVLADSTGIENQNDKSGLMFLLPSASDTLEIFLEKDNVQVGQMTGTTYGTDYPLGSITYYTDQALLVGYSLEWSKVLVAHGIGNYRIRIDYTTLGILEQSYSNNFNLKQFSYATSQGSIRIESYMNGYMMRERINYKGLEFCDMIRIRGWFGNPEEKLTVTNDLFANSLNDKRVVVQRKVNQVDSYLFECFPLPKCVADKIRYYHFFANTIYMSDYNLYNYDWDLKRIKVLKEDAFTFKYTGTTRSVIIRGKLTEQIQDNEKTNC